MKSYDYIQAPFGEIISGLFIKGAYKDRHFKIEGKPMHNGRYCEIESFLECIPDESLWFVARTSCKVANFLLFMESQGVITSDRAEMYVYTDDDGEVEVLDDDD